jgi:outer membrane protein assembly factor BamB
MGSSRRWLVAGALLVLAACSKDKDVDQPAKLTEFTATIRAEKVWTASVADKGAKPLRLGLGLAVDGNHVYAAGHKGEVAAFDLASGRSLWHAKTKLALSGGPGTGAGLVVVGSTFGDLVALNATDGAVRWKVRLNGEVLSAPAVGERLIAVRTVDGKLHGLSLKDGQELWAQEQQVPRLLSSGRRRFRLPTVRRSWSVSMMSTRPSGSPVLTSMPLVSRGVWQCSPWIPAKFGGHTTHRAFAELALMMAPSTSQRPMAKS